MDIKRLFGTNLRMLRTERGYSQEFFSELCGLHRTYISDIECFRRNVSLESIQKIADALKIDSYILFIDNSQSNKTAKGDNIDGCL